MKKKKTKNLKFGVEKCASKKNHNVNVVAMHMHETVARIHLASDHSLILDGKYKIALVHMIKGYEAEHYELPKTGSLKAPSPLWKLRYQMEISTAIISPTMRAQLAGTKRVQQV